MADGLDIPGQRQCRCRQLQQTDFVERLRALLAAIRASGGQPGDGGAGNQRAARPGSCIQSH